MSYQFSRNLGELLDKFQDDTPIDLSALAKQLPNLFGENREAVTSLLSCVKGTMLPGTLHRHLSDSIVCDSVVRDVLTTGHLAKLLSRFDVLIELSNPVIIGLPNSLFDDQSQFERAEFFAAGNILPIDAEILDNSQVKQMLRREAGEPGAP